MLITLDNGEDHTKPNTLGPRGLTEYNNALDAALARDDVAAIAITGKPFIFAAGADLKALGRLTDREQAVTIARIGHAVFDKLHTVAGADLRLPQRAGPRRRPGDRPALRLPDGVQGGGRDRPAGVLPRPAARLGRRLSAAQPDRSRQRGHGDHRERPEPEQDAGRAAGREARHRRRDVRRRRLPGRLAGLGRPGGGRRGHRRPARDRPRRGLGRRGRARPEDRRQKTSGAAPGAVPGAGADRAGADRRPGRPRSPPRTRAWPI